MSSPTVNGCGEATDKDKLIEDITVFYQWMEQNL
jgi:hypothetical protein